MSATLPEMSATLSTKDCIICRDELNNENKYKTICNHTFCKDCVYDWVELNNSCPLCRKENIITFCKECKKECEININGNCIECQFKLTDLKFEKEIKDKIVREIVRDFNNLSKWKRFKIISKIKLKLKMLKMKKIIKKKCTLKNLIKLPADFCLFITGAASKNIKYKVPYHISLCIFHAVMASLVPPLYGSIITILIMMSIGNGLYGLLQMCNNERENEEDREVERLMRSVD